MLIVATSLPVTRSLATVAKVELLTVADVLSVDKLSIGMVSTITEVGSLTGVASTKVEVADWKKRVGFRQNIVRYLQKSEWRQVSSTVAEVIGSRCRALTSQNLYFRSRRWWKLEDLTVDYELEKLSC